MCNCIDTFCYCDSSECVEEECPYPYCYHDCGSNTHVLPTGSMENCVNEYDLHDINGNVWEFDSSGTGRVNGGAYNCSDSLKLHKCSNQTIFGISPRYNVGFRCCKNPE